MKSGVRLEDIFKQVQSGETATLNVVLKADVQGSLEAVTESLRKLEREGVDLTFVHRAVGGITENDITLAATTNATILGFNVRPDRKAREAADTEGVEIRTYEIIYKLLEDIEQAMVGMLAPEYEEVVTGEAEVREIFRVPRIGAIAGCYVLSGVITRGSKVRFLREGTVIWKGEITSLRRFKEDAREVREGFECGIGLSDFQDLKPGDIIETFDEREIARYLTTHPHPSATTWLLVDADRQAHARAAATGIRARRGSARRCVRSSPTNWCGSTTNGSSWSPSPQIEVDNELNRAIVFFDSLAGPDGDGAIIDALGEHRVRLQASIARQIRAKKTPILDFRPDDVIRSAERIEESSGRAASPTA